MRQGENSATLGEKGWSAGNSNTQKETRREKKKKANELANKTAFET